MPIGGELNNKSLLSLARNEENFQNFLQVGVCIREVILDLRKKRKIQ